jgi:hypothetical protein
MTDPLTRLAKRVEADPFFLAAALAVYARTEGLDDAGLAAALGLPADKLPHLKLCRPPRPEAEHFWADVEHLAGRFGIPPEPLADAVRRGQAVMQLRDATLPADTGAGAFLAARDADPPGGAPP